MPNTLSHSVPSERRFPTVVVARRAKAGREREFERWQRRLATVASKAPGHRGAEVQPPNSQHPGEWVVVYQFRDQESLGYWMKSAERESLLFEGAELLDGEAREQIVALMKHEAPVTAVASFRLTAQGRDRFDEIYSRIVESMVQFSGFIRSERFEEIEGIQEETTVVFSFGSRELLDGWLCSTERRELLEEIEPYLESDRTVNIVGGFAGWFGHREELEVKLWKQACVVLLALFPTALILTLLRAALLPEVGLVLGVLLGNIAGVVILTWVLMPLLTRVLDGWLRR